MDIGKEMPQLQVNFTGETDWTEHIVSQLSFKHVIDILLGREKSMICHLPFQAAAGGKF